VGARAWGRCDKMRERVWARMTQCRRQRGESAILIDMQSSVGGAKPLNPKRQRTGHNITGNKNLSAWVSLGQPCAHGDPDWSDRTSQLV
jgi:hypothetical protein